MSFMRLNAPPHQNLVHLYMHVCRPQEFVGLLITYCMASASAIQGVNLAIYISFAAGYKYSYYLRVF